MSAGQDGLGFRWARGAVRSRRRPLMVGTAGVMLALAGCSGSSGSHPGASSSPSTPSAPSGSSAPSASSTAGAQHLRIKNFAFHPASLTVKAGTVVTVTNNDQTTHTVTATGGKPFDTGDISPGKTVTFTAPKRAGTYHYICTIHPFMKGTVTVG